MERVLGKHLLSRAYLVCVVRGVPVRISDLDLDQVSEQPEPDASARVLHDFNGAAYRGQQQLLEVRHLHEALVVDRDHELNTY